MKCLVIDDHPVVRAGLVALLGAGGDVALQARDAEEAERALAESADLDVVILDLRMPKTDGLTLLAHLGRIRPDLPVVVLSSSEDPHDVRRALAQGALGYVPKSASQATLLSALKLVLDGEIYVPPLMLNDVTPAAAPAEPSGRDAAARLTDRQVDVLRMLGDGSSNKVIAHRLGLSEKTVKAHVSAVFRALDVVNRTQAANAGRDLGLL